MSSIMILLFVIFGLSHANVLHDIDRCFTHHDFCDVTLDNQCCSGYECRPIINKANSLVAVCLKKAFLGEECIIDQNCWKPDYAYCSKNKTCQCQNGYTRSYEILCSSLYLGAHCSYDIHCKVDNSECINSECKCAEGFQPLSNNQCVSKFLKKSCEHDEDCGDPMYVKCSEIGRMSEKKKCACRRSTVLTNNSTCQSLLGWFCEDDNQCAVKDSICVNNICQCGHDDIPLSSNRCGPYPLGKACRLNKDCENLLFHSRCSKEYLCTYESYKGMY